MLRSGMDSHNYDDTWSSLSSSEQDTLTGTLEDLDPVAVAVGDMDPLLGI